MCTSLWQPSGAASNVYQVAVAVIAARSAAENAHDIAASIACVRPCLWVLSDTAENQVFAYVKFACAVLLSLLDWRPR